MTLEQILAVNSLNGNAAKKFLASNMNFGVLRTNTVLHKDDWVDLDRRVIQIAQEKLTVVSDLTDRGLTYELGGIGKTVSQWQTEGDMSPANVSMEPDTEGERDLVNYELAQVPIPIIHKDFRLGMRQIAAAREAGSNIDMSNADAATRQVAISMEDMVILGYQHTIGGGRIYGYTNHPYRATLALDDGLGNLLPFTVENAARMILDMIQKADDDEYYGPFNLYLPTGMSTVLYEIIPNTNGKMLKQHLEEIDLIQEVKIASRMPKGNMTLVQMTSDNVDIAVGQPLIPVEWNEKGGMAVNYKILTAMAPRLKARQDRKLGVVHAKFQQGK